MPSSKNLEPELRQLFQNAWNSYWESTGAQLRELWEQQLEKALQERFTAAGRSLTRQLNHAARRLLLAESFSEWCAILLEAAKMFCGRAEIFDTADRDIMSAPAIATVVETKDTVVAMKSASELPAKVCDMAESGHDRCWLFPIEKGSRTAAILYAEGDSGEGVDRDALELLALLASASLPRLTARPAADLVQIEPDDSASSGTSQWKLSRKEQEAHLKALRFVRVLVAEIRLFEEESVRQGRQNGDLYLRLKAGLDRGRQDFDRQFLRTWPSMADYYHQEVIRTLANDDVAAMGLEYPGAMR